MKRHTLLLLSSLTMGIPFAVAQEHKHTADSLKTVAIEEVLVSRNQSVGKKSEAAYRASKQANIDKLLDRAAGVQMVRRGNYAWEPSIRSLNAGQVNLTIDGMAIFGACTDRMDPVSSYIEPTNLQQLSINLGPSFSNYGGALAGGIDFKLAQADLAAQEQFKGLIGTGYESNSSSIQTLASLHYKRNRFAFLANGIFRKSDNYQAAKQVVVPNSQYQKWNSNFALSYQLNSRNEISAQYLMDLGNDIGYPALTMDVAFANAHIASITHIYKPTAEHLLPIRSKFYYNKIDHAMDDTKRPAEEVAMHMDMPGNTWTAGLYTEGGWASAKHMLQSRLSAYINRATANMTMYPKEGSPMFMYTLPDAQRSFVSIDLAHSLLSTGNWGLETAGTFSLSNSSIYSEAGKDQLSGMLTDRFDRHNLLLNLHSSLHWTPSANWHFHTKLGYGNRSASLQEYYGFYLFNRLDSYDYLGNAALKSEKLMQGSLSASYKQAWVQVELTGFHYYFKDYMAGMVQAAYGVMTPGAKGVKQYQNLPSAQLSGGELSLQLKPWKFLDLMSTVTYTRGKDNENYALPLIAPLTNLNTLSTQYKGYAFQLEMENHAAQKHISTERYGDLATPEASLFNAAFRKTFNLPKQRLIAAMRVENIFDKYYYRHLDIMKIARPGRNFIAQVTFAF